MRGRLFLLNVLLLAGIAAAAMELKTLLEETRKREELVRASAPRLPAGRPAGAVPMVEKTTPANYWDVAARLLLSKDRNPNVQPPPPPAPPVIPPFPFAYGVLMIADPPIVMMSVAKGGPQKGYRPGDKVGSFKLARVTAQGVTLEWEGQTFQKRYSELADKDGGKAGGAPVASNGAGEGAPPSSALPPSGAPADQPKAVQTLSGGSDASKTGPGVDVTPTMKQCVPGDPTPDGAVVNGYKKFNTATPFGFQCRWEKVQ